MDAQRAGNVLGPPLNTECPICLDEFHGPDDDGRRLLLTMCWHLIHDECMTDLKAAAEEGEQDGGDGSTRCPICRGTIVVKLDEETTTDRRMIVIAPEGPLDLGYVQLAEQDRVIKQAMDRAEASHGAGVMSAEEQAACFCGESRIVPTTDHTALPLSMSHGR